jgi:hypothetical protein
MSSAFVCRLPQEANAGVATVTDKVVRQRPQPARRRSARRQSPLRIPAQGARKERTGSRTRSASSHGVPIHPRSHPAVAAAAKVRRRCTIPSHVRCRMLCGALLCATFPPSPGSAPESSLVRPGRGRHCPVKRGIVTDIVLDADEPSPTLRPAWVATAAGRRELVQAAQPGGRHVF